MTRAAILLFLAAFVLRFALVLLLPNFGVLPLGEMERAALSWAKSGELANPYSTPTGPTAHLAPVYPILLGTIYQVFGAGSAGHLAEAIFGCALSAARCAFILPLAVLLGLGIRVGWIAGLFSTVYISAFNTELRGSWEAPVAALFLIALTAMAARFGRAPAFTYRRAGLYGVFAGCAILLSPVLAAPIAAFLLCTIPLGMKQLSRYIFWIATLTLTAFVIVLHG